METFIYKYLSAHYEISTTEASSKKITICNTYGIFYKNDTAKTKNEIYSDTLLKEVSSVFSIDTKKAKQIINKWAKSINKKVDLTDYWNKLDGLLPIVTRIASTLIGQELVSVQPMSSFGLFLDFTYSSNTNTGTCSVTNEYIKEILDEKKEDEELGKSINN